MSDRSWSRFTLRAEDVNDDVMNALAGYNADATEIEGLVVFEDYEAVGGGFDDEAALMKATQAAFHHAWDGVVGAYDGGITYRKGERLVEFYKDFDGRPLVSVEDVRAGVEGVLDRFAFADEVWAFIFGRKKK